MKLRFASNLDYQQRAIAAAVDLFDGQKIRQSEFTVTMPEQYQETLAGMGRRRAGIGIGNRLTLSIDDIEENLHKVQLRNGLPQTHINGGLAKGLDFDIEMETGTGKTYVYLRTMLELTRRYGFTKFIIVVPSIAIREGTYKNLEITKDHFDGLYHHMPYDYFIYDSGKLDQVRNFATSTTAQIMIINIDAFRKGFTDPSKETKANIIHRANDRLNGMRPIELIQETHPIVIIDEPQSVDTTEKAKEAIRSLHPLAIFRYSATHREHHNLIYKLDAVDAYNLHLVKGIEVASFEAKDEHNLPYMRLKSVQYRKAPISARVELDVKNKKGEVKRKVVTVRQGDDFVEKSGGRDVYDGYIVKDILCEPGRESMDFLGSSDVLRLHAVLHSVDDSELKRQQMEATIREHLDKELQLCFTGKGIKVLSLFFIDRVANYRQYDKDGTERKGPYALWFEEIYKRLIDEPKYQPLRDRMGYGGRHVEDYHDGYFSSDPKGGVKDTKGTTAADDTTYNLIMRDKEKLLSFRSHLRFIFSHSALREGWDNPNVFQICTLNETKSEIKKRQEIGRGLRLCVDQEGNRVYGEQTNILTVMANESYDEFAEKLQHEYEEDMNIRFGYLEVHNLANLVVGAPGRETYLGTDRAQQLIYEMTMHGYLREDGKVEDALRLDLRDGHLQLSPEFQPFRAQITEVCTKACGNLNIRNKADKRRVHLNKKVYLDDDFKVLWDKIKWKTRYRVEFSEEELVRRCVEGLRNELVVTHGKLVYKKAALSVKESGVDAEEHTLRTVQVLHRSGPLPDIVRYLQNETNLTRKTIVDILIRSRTLEKFKKNPQSYMEGAAKIIRARMETLLLQGIKYTRLGSGEYYAMELFEEGDHDLCGYLGQNLVQADKTPYDYVIYDSSVEKTFAERFEKDPDIKLYAKLPKWFRISTPLGWYNPDWAVVRTDGGKEKLYLIVETKGNTAEESLRPTEAAKIRCGKKHFASLGTGVKLEKASAYEDWKLKDQDD